MAGFSPRAGPVARPIIRRSRSWRGVMQVRFNDSRADSKKIGRQAFFWAPMRILTLGVTATAVLYLALGHDAFMHTLMGYESEMQYEARVNPIGAEPAPLDRDRSWKSPLRQLEQPLYPKREFDVFKESGEKS